MFVGGIVECEGELLEGQRKPQLPLPQLESSEATCVQRYSSHELEGRVEFRGSLEAHWVLAMPTLQHRKLAPPSLLWGRILAKCEIFCWVL